MSGHRKWSEIKRAKGVVDVAECRCCMGRGWVLGRRGRVRCWVCFGRGLRAA